MAKKRLFLIDATAFCYRAFYALQGLSTSFGQPTNAIYGFINILNKILKDHAPDYLAVCFDVSRDTFRAKKFAEYKMNRPPMPEGLSSQIPIIKEVIKAYNIAIYEKEGFEADDIIASISGKAEKTGVLVTVVSSDKDMLQLVNSNISVFSPYKDTGTLYDKEKVQERFGIDPEQVPDLIALMGDSVDNIPGIPGIGEKTASSLVKKFGSVGKLINGLSGIESLKLKKSIEDNIETIKLNRELAELNKGIDIDVDLKALEPKPANYEELFRIYKRLEFKKLLQSLPQAEEKQAQAEVLKDSQLKGLIAEGEELALYGKSLQEMVFSCHGRIFLLKDPGANIKAILCDDKIKKVGHDLKNIKLNLFKQGVALEGLCFDTMIAGYLLNPSKPGFSLVDLSLDYLDIRVNAESLGNPRAVSLITELKPRLEQELKGKGLDKLFRETELPLVEVLSEMEMAGIKLDTAVLKELSNDLGKRLVILVKDIFKLSGSEFNINSPKQLAEVLFEKLKLPVVKRTKTGPSTDEEVLRNLAVSHELPALLLEYRQLTKLKNTYIDPLPQLIDAKTGMIHTSFNQTGTETGRLSSANPNLQNLPIKSEAGSQIRRAVVAFDKNSLLISCDYSQIELRILAHLSKDKKLISAFLDGKDIHKATAALIYNIGPEEVTKAMREVAKRINFGIIYGLSSWGLSRDLKIPVVEAQNFIDSYFAKYSRVKEYIDEQIALAKKEGFVTTILGRRRYLPEINSKNISIRQLAERQAVNTPIQGSASDLIKLAMIRIQKEIKDFGLRSRMIMQIHDELVFNVPSVELEEFSGNVRNAMEGVLKLDVPVKVSIKKGRNWLEMEEVR